LSEPDITTEELRGAVQEFLHREVAGGAPGAEGEHVVEWRRRLRSGAAEMGWFGVGIPSLYGGLGLDLPHAAVLFEEAGASRAPIPILGTVAVAQAILRAGSEEQKKRYLPLLASGKCAGGLDSASLASFRLQRKGNQLTLSGQSSTFLVDDNDSLLLVSARSDTGQVEMLLLDTRQRGIAVRRVPTVDPTRDFGYVQLHDFAIEPAEFLSPNGRASEAVTRQVSFALACDAIGGTAAILEMTLEYLRNRSQFGRPIGSFQALKHRCADHRIRLDSCRALVERAVAAGEAIESGIEDALPLIAKAVACDDYASVAADCLQLHGGIGFTWEHACHAFLRRAKLNQALFGTSAQFLDLAASLCMGTRQQRLGQ
jgi:alkylation response protein AidB-like acyl-CoA dehydrogenase